MLGFILVPLQLSGLVVSHFDKSVLLIFYSTEILLLINMMIDFVPSQFLINVVRKVQQPIPNQPSVESNFLLRAVRIKNTTDKTVQITKYVSDLKAKGKSQKQILYSRETVQERSTALS